MGRRLNVGVELVVAGRATRRATLAENDAAPTRNTHAAKQLF